MSTAVSNGSGTVPARFPRYIISPSLPKANEKSSTSKVDPADADGSKKAVEALPQLHNAYLVGTLGTLGGTMNDTRGSASDPSFEDTLSRIGPSARRLLELDEAQRKEGRKTDKDGSTSVKSKTPRDHPTQAEYSLFKNSTRNGKQTSSGRFTATLSGTLSKRSKRECGKILNDNPSFKCTITQDPNKEPPLVKTLNNYLTRELQLTAGTGTPLTSKEALGPYREALSALITAFPGYSKLLCDIQTAYDNVLQSQSELLTEAYAKEMTNIQIVQQHQENSFQLRLAVSKLEKDLAEMEVNIAEREKKAALTAEMRNHAGHSRADNIELRKQLDVATVRVEELESMTKGDSEKILVLIGAVRECDKRLKAYEKKVAYMSGQVAELNEFQRLAGEAQTELQKYKHKFRAYVSAEDFESMKNHLTSELANAHNLARQLRRTATVRGTQVDVMLRKIRQLEYEQQIMLEADNPSALLTPRPEWKRVYDTIPDLEEHAKPIHNDSLSQISSTNKPQTEEVDTAERLVVDGPNNTGLQVEYLVKSVLNLKHRLEVVEVEKAEIAEKARKDHLLYSTRPPIAADAPSGHNGNRQGQPKVQVGSKRRSQVEIVATVVVTLPPIIAPGMRTSIPVCFRCTGVVERLTVKSGTALKIIYDFFVNELMPSLELQDPNQFVEYDVGAMFLEFLEKRIAREEDLGAYSNAPHVALNLLEDSKDPLLRTPPLTLFIHVLQGLLPVRLAMDCTTVITQVVEDLTAVAKEQQKSRIRRQAISECLLPILELKTPEEIVELRTTLGHDASFDIYSLISIENKFLTTMFHQQCQASMDMYGKLLKALTAHSTELSSEEYDRTITPEAIGAAVKEAEPSTPDVIIQELTENSTRRPDDSSSGIVEEKLRLSDVITAIDVAPIFLRTPLCTKEECLL